MIFLFLQAACLSIHIILVMDIAMMKQIMKDAHMMEVIAVETVPIRTFVLNVLVMMEGHCHLIYHVSLANILESTMLHKIFVFVKLENPKFCYTLLRKSKLVCPICCRLCRVKKKSCQWNNWWYISNQQVVLNQVGLKMGTVMMLQTIKSVTLMGVIAVDQTSIRNIAQSAYALKIWTVLLH